MGKQVNCPSCGNLLTVPAHAASVPTASPVSTSSAQPIVVSCLCGSSFKANASLSGTRAACPACGGPLDIPSAATTSDDPLFGDDLGVLLSQSMAAPAPGPKPTTLSGPIRQTQETDFRDVVRRVLKRVSLGISSFAVSMLAGLVYLIMIVSTRNMSQAELRANESLSFTLGMMIISMLLACLGGAVLGAVSVKHDGRDRVLAYLGATFNVMIILFIGCCGVLGVAFKT